MDQDLYFPKYKVPKRLLFPKKRRGYFLSCGIIQISKYMMTIKLGFHNKHCLNFKGNGLEIQPTFSLSLDYIVLNARRYRSGSTWYFACKLERDFRIFVCNCIASVATQMIVAMQKFLKAHFGFISSYKCHAQPKFEYINF